MKKLILASNSPRRRELLAQLISGFEVVPSSFEENQEGLSAYKTALAFATGKAREVFSRYQDAFVLGADTVVAQSGVILGKPKDERDAHAMLALLSGKTHSVYTGVCLVGKDFVRKEVVETLVTCRTLTEREIQAYIESGSPMDKAGAYGIQDGVLVQSYEGSYTNVVGLPLETVRSFLKEGGIC